MSGKKVVGKCHVPCNVITYKEVGTYQIKMALSHYLHVHDLVQMVTLLHAAMPVLVS